MLRYEADTTASSEIAWALLARPRNWPRWSPHVRGAWGLGNPEVREGARGAARLLGIVPVPATIVAVAPGRSWTWRAGAVIDMEHRVEPHTDRDPAARGCTLAIVLRAPAPVEAALRVTYGPLVGALVRHLAHVAATDVAPR